MSEENEVIELEEQTDSVEQASEKPKKSRRGWLIAIVVVLVFAGFAWYYYYGPCGITTTQEALEELADISDDFMRQASIADSTPRISLSGPIMTMQNTYEDLNDLEVPGCLEEVKYDMLTGMYYTMNGYLAFMSSEEDQVINDKFEDAAKYIIKAERKLREVQDCIPFCSGP